MTSTLRQQLPSSSCCSAVELLKSNYRHLGGPQQVCERFVSYLLTNPQTLQTLTSIVVQDINEQELVQQKKRLHSSSTLQNNNESLQIQVFSILKLDPILGNLLLRYPSTLLPLFEDAAVQAQQVLYQRFQNDIDSNTNHHNCRRYRIRLTHLPPNHNCKSTLSTINAASNVGRILQLSGTVVRASPACMMEYSRCYVCKKCSHSITVQVDLSTPALAIPNPNKTCPNCQAKNTMEKQQQIQNGSTHADYQQVKIQESVDQSSTRQGNNSTTVPRSILLQLTHDLVDSCKPGDEVVVVGTLQAQWPTSTSALLPQVDYHITTSLLVHSIRVLHKQDSFSSDEPWLASSSGVSKTNNKDGIGNNPSSDNPRDKYPQEFQEYWTHQQQPVAARNYIVGAMCPKLYGLFTIKLGLLLTLIGGSSLSDIHQQDDAVSSEKKRKRSSQQRENDEPEQFAFKGNSGVSQQPSDTATGWSSSATMGSASTSHEVIQTKRRAQSHILLVGEAGQGKSQLLKFAAALSPRSVLTTGTGCSSAGLTVAAVRDPSLGSSVGGGNSRGGNSEFTLEAGALVLADMGVCCIDEFGCIRQEDRTTIHEAMEQQTISVAKAGIVCKLNARATIVAVMNPTKGGRYDLQASLAQNTNLASPLLSRFDLIFLLMDTTTAERDDKIASFLLNHAIQPDDGNNASGQQNKNDNNGLLVSTEPLSSSHSHHWSMDKLRAYIAIIKSKFHPTLTSEAATLLQRYYEDVRTNSSFSTCQLPITVRFLESLIRLSQAHARLMYRNTVTLVDAVAVILLMRQSCAGSYSRGNSHVQPFLLHEDCPTQQDADVEFEKQQGEVLAKYGMITNAGDDSNDESGDWTTYHLRQQHSYEEPAAVTASSSSWHDYPQDNHTSFTSNNNTNAFQNGWD